MASTENPTHESPPEPQGPRLLVAGPGPLRQVPLPPKGKVLIGRSSEAEISIDDGSVSRRHALLHLGTFASIEDLGTRNGSFVRGERIEKGKKVAIRPGDLVRVGSVVVAIEYGRAAAPPGREGAKAASAPTGSDAPPLVIAPAMKRVHEVVERVARGPINVLLLGETGTGKEVVARTVHARSPRAGGPFVAINCAALSETLLESELFGHEKGAFTGAVEARAGMLESANGGTVFLDEVGEMPPPVQAKLLRVLEERAVQPLGAARSRPIDVRFVTATNRDLEAEVAAGRFRRDLYFRLNGVPVSLPPLRERPEEVEPLARRFLASFAGQLGLGAPPELGAAALETLRAHSWPGNVRELRNVVERAVLLAEGGEIGPEHFAPLAGAAPPPLASGGPIDRERIVRALEACGGNQTRAAAMLGISRRTLTTKLNALDLPRPRKRAEEERP